MPQSRSRLVDTNGETGTASGISPDESPYDGPVEVSSPMDIAAMITPELLGPSALGPKSEIEIDQTPQGVLKSFSMEPATTGRMYASQSISGGMGGVGCSTPKESKPGTRPYGRGSMYVRRSYMSDWNLAGKSSPSPRPELPGKQKSLRFARRFEGMVESWERRQTLTSSPVLESPEVPEESPLKSKHQSDNQSVDSTVKPPSIILDDRPEFIAVNFQNTVDRASFARAVTYVSPTSLLRCFLVNLFCPFLDIFPTFANAFFADSKWVATAFSLLFFSAEVSMVVMYNLFENPIVEDSELWEPIVIHVWLCFTYSLIVSTERMDPPEWEHFDEVAALNTELVGMVDNESTMMTVRDVVNAIEEAEDDGAYDVDSEIRPYYAMANVGGLVHASLAGFQKAFNIYRNKGLYHLLDEVSTWSLASVMDSLDEFAKDPSVVLGWLCFFVNVVLVWGGLLCLSLAVSTYVRRLKLAEFFSCLTSPFRATTARLPYISLGSAREIRGWLTLRSILMRKGPQHTVETILTAAALSVVILAIGIPISRLIVHKFLPVDHFTLSVFCGALLISIYLWKILRTATQVQRKYSDVAMLLGEQLRITMREEEAEDGNARGKLTSVRMGIDILIKLLKETEPEFSQHLLGMPITESLVRVLMGLTLSTLSATFTTVLGFNVLIR